MILQWMERVYREKNDRTRMKMTWKDENTSVKLIAKG